MSSGRNSTELPLVPRIARLIREGGAMPLGRYMEICLADREHGYYMTRDPFGVDGDFTTAPEVSQMFGELIGLWAVDTWTKIGAPTPFTLVELGPGRGTLMADALRAARVMPEFRAAVRIHLVETSPLLRARQRESLAGALPKVAWHDDLSDIPEGPAIFIANEFFDALPVSQFEIIDGHWRERLVVLSGDGALAIGHGPAIGAASPGLAGNAPAGTIAERSLTREEVAAALGAHIAVHQGAALIIDYGHTRRGFGDTLQAVRGHRRVGIFDAPGESDLTSHVDFTALADAAHDAGAGCHGPIEMGPFLRALGIVERAGRLAAGKDAPTRATIDAALTRLTDPDAMGSLFKVLALSPPGAPVPEPFGYPQAR